jgi:hypothetical protein
MWDTTALDLRTLGSMKDISLRFVEPTLRKEREGWGTRNLVAELGSNKTDIDLHEPLAQGIRQ